MSLQPGTRLGPYEVIAQIGVGGMGEVYKATDTNLKRPVAIKVLPASVAGDPDRLARFQREAEVLAALNHPNIAAIYGLERSGTTTALVMELVEGPTLADRIAQGAISLDEALPIAKQIAEALEAAHEQGIIHRDLKPANVKVRPDGVVKVLDFGLAKAMEPSGGMSPGATQSPTITTPAMMTGVGMILGTAAYMSPEQARGKPVDKRADIWAFGAVLFEMLTGRRAFPGEDITDTLAAVVRSEPDWSLVPGTVSPVLLVFLRRCLQKDLKHRIGDIHDVRLALDGVFETAVPQASAPVAVPPRRRIALVGAVALLAGAVIATTLTWFAARPADPMPPRVSRLAFAPSGTAALTIHGLDRDLAITPDGSRVVYVGNRGAQLFVRTLDVLAPVAVFTGTAHGPFVSPDGQWIGFSDDNQVLKRVAVTGGPAVTVTTLGGVFQGATWVADETIVFATTNAATGLQRVGATGGPTTVLTRPNRAQGEADHVWPERLPSGRAVLFTITAQTGGLDAAQVAVLDLQTGMRKVVVRGGSHAHYVPSGPGSPTRAGREGGHLVYAASSGTTITGTLWAVPFDLAALETRGTPVPVIPAVMMTVTGGMDAAVAGDGTLAYVLGGGNTDISAPRTLVGVDRQGRETPIPAPPRAYAFPRFSPDGARVVVFAADQGLDLWLWDLGRASLTRATFDPAVDVYPVWTPDGRRVIFGSGRSGALNLSWQAADGTGAVERLTESPNTQYPTAVSPDGRGLIFTETTPKTGDDVMQIELDGTYRITPLVSSGFAERNGVISPDGRWLAYEANDSGRLEIWVRPFPEVNSGHWQVSTAGGTRPLWARSGQELFYVSPTGALMRVGVERAQSWATTPPTLLLKEGYFTSPGGLFSGRTYDISPDGQRFLMVKEGKGTDQTAAPPQVIVVQHFDEELKRLVPIK